VVIAALDGKVQFESAYCGATDLCTLAIQLQHTLEAIQGLGSDE
jgi:hypothetical protein